MRVVTALFGCLAAASVFSDGSAEEVPISATGDASTTESESQYVQMRSKSMAQHASSDIVIFYLILTGSSFLGALFAQYEHNGQEF